MVLRSVTSQSYLLQTLFFWIYPVFGKIGSVEMLNNNLNAHGGFNPAAVAPPNAITPEQVLRHHGYKCRGGMGGQALSPPSKY